MARISASDVGQIIQIPSGMNVTSQVETASLLVEETLASQGLTEARLKQIELYLAAHFVAINTEKGAIIRDSKGESRQDYAPNSYGKGLQSTRYGQQAAMLDTSGLLASAVGGVVKAEFRLITADKASDP